MTGKILMVDDDTALLATMRRVFRGRFDITTAASGKEGLERLDHDCFAVVVSDFRMPEMSGLEFLSRVRECSPDTVTILLTGYADLTTALTAVNECRVFRLLMKPAETAALEAALQSGLEQYRLVVAKHELDQLKSKFNLDIVYKLRSIVVRANLYLYALERGRAPAQGDTIAKLKHQHLELAQLASSLLSVAYLDLASSATDYVLLDLNAIVEEVLTVCTDGGEGMAPVIYPNLAPDLPPIWGNHSQVQMVVTSLLIHALNHAGAAAIVVETHADEGKVQLQVVTDQTVRIRSISQLFAYQYHKQMTLFHISDNGVGMKLANDVMQRHAGRLEVDDGVGMSRALVWFPVVPSGDGDGEPGTKLVPEVSVAAVS